MSRENVEMIRRGFEAWLADDLDSAFADIDEDVVTRVVAPLPDPAEWHGHQGLLDGFAQWAGTFEELEMKDEDYTDAGDHVVVRVAQQVRAGGSGVPVKGTFWFVFGLRAGKVVTFEVFDTRAHAFEAVGLQGQPPADSG